MTRRIAWTWVVGLSLAACKGSYQPADDNGDSGSESGTTSPDTDDSDSASTETAEGTDGTDETDGTDTTDTTDSTDTGPGDCEGDTLTLTLLGRYETDLFDAEAAIDAVFHPPSNRLYVVDIGGTRIDVLDISDPAIPIVDGPGISTADWGLEPRSIAIRDDVIAVAVAASPKTAPGRVVFFDPDGVHLGDVTVGALPDHVAFTPDGTKLVVAAEGEPNQSYSVDPEGEIDIIAIGPGTEGAMMVTQGDVEVADFGAAIQTLDPKVRIFGPDASVLEDLEPEYVAISPDSGTAWVSLQDNNAIAIVDLDTAVVTDIVALGFKDHSMAGNELDATDDDGGPSLATWPVLGMYQPDGMAVFEHEGQIRVLTANEGDGRDYDPGLVEDERIGDLTLDPQAFPDPNLQDDDQLGRLRASIATGDLDDDGDHDELHVFGGRSISILDAAANMLWDSGDELERKLSQVYPEGFNADNDQNDKDQRSDDKGPEPEHVVVAEVFGTRYGFVGLERVGGIMVFDLDDPSAPVYHTYVNDRNLGATPGTSEAGPLAPENLLFVPALDSPTGRPLIVAPHEVSGSTEIYELCLE